MPRDKDRKRLVRSRMAATGERYTVARAALGAPATDPALGDARALVAQLDREQASEAWTRLRAAPAEVLRTVAIEGLRSTSWKIRRACARLLDDLPLTDDTRRALSEALADPEPRVRIAAPLARMRGLQTRSLRRGRARARRTDARRPER